MKEKKKIKRSTLLIILAIAIAVGLGARLFYIQIIKGDYYSSVGTGTIVKKVDIDASRGEILDSSGTPLVYNKQTTKLVFDASFFPSSTDNSARADIIIKLINYLESNKEKWNDELPLEFNKSGKIAFKKNHTADIKYLKSDKYLDLNDYATAQNCFDALKEMYGLKNYSDKDARKIASVRYGLVVGAFSVQNPYTFADEVSDETAAYVEENKAVFQGVDAEATTLRKYKNGSLCPHLLGTIGAITAEELKKDDNSTKYKLTDYIGKSGIEKVCESYLKGKNGKKTVYSTSSGEVSSVVTKEPEQGNTVTLTIDAKMQQIAQDALEKKVESLRATVNSKSAGAVVAIDCNSGAVLCAATYPSYNNQTYTKDYDKLAADSTSPLWDRTVMSAYAPGSTFKPCMAIAGLEEGAITTQTYFNCQKYYPVGNVKFKCLDYHGEQNVTSAINHSCNIFFYNVGRRLGINKMNRYATMFGLGQATGVEIPETTGTLAGLTEREASGGSWYIGDTIQAAIGQSDNLFTPLQLANYCATIANGGTRYEAHFIKSITNYNNTKTIVDKTEPKVAYKMNISSTNLRAVQKGMEEVGGYGGFCWEAYKNLPVSCAAKTGTSQVKETVNGYTSTYNNGILITYAPADNPQIAIAQVIERADSGSSTAEIAAAIFKYYFTKNASSTKTNSSSSSVSDSTTDVNNTLVGDIHFAFENYIN